MHYTILERTKTRYFAELRSTDAWSGGNPVAYETGRIIPHDAYQAFGKTIDAGESLVGNEQFGKDKHECSMTPQFKEGVYKEYLAGVKLDSYGAKRRSGK